MKSLGFKSAKTIDLNLEMLNSKHIALIMADGYKVAADILGMEGALV